MLVKMNIGRHQGEVRDIRNDQARRMLKNGDATKPTRAEIRAAKETAVALDDDEPETADAPAQTTGRRRGRPRGG